MKLLIICGPTATGKTKLAVSLSKEFNGEIISADSRQIYRGLDIGTGKDKPKDVEIWGYDFANPEDSFSVANYQILARAKIVDVWQNNKLPILAGGSGLYIKAVVDGVSTVHIPPNESLRESLSSKTPFDLFILLSRLNPTKAKSLNISDRNNPRRLIRAIEIASEVGDEIYSQKDDAFVKDTLFVGLNIPVDFLRKKITKRVAERIKQGMQEEVESLVRKGVAWDSQALSSIGYKYWKQYFLGLISMNELQERWTSDEVHYAKKQMTWFKKDPRINWFDASSDHFLEEVEALVKKWHNMESLYA